MKRWFISRLGDYENEGTRVPVTNKYKPNGQLRTAPEDPTMPSWTWTKPGFDWCGGKLATTDLSVISTDPDIFLIPDAALDNLVSSLSASTRNTMNTRLNAAGFDTSAIKLTWTIREVLQHIKSQLGTNNNVEAGDVREP